jgi:hypothetical protein
VGKLVVAMNNKSNLVIVMCTAWLNIMYWLVVAMFQSISIGNSFQLSANRLFYKKQMETNLIE